MSLLRSEIAARVFNTPLLVHEGKAKAGLMAIGGRIVEGGVTFADDIAAIDHTAFAGGRPSMGRLGDGLGRAFDREGRMTFDMVDGVAIIPIEGTLVHKGSYVGMASGRTSYQGIQTQVQRAARAESVKGVVFEVDSFGGQASGAFDTAEMIAGLSAEKPTMAILTDFALSAGYLLASAARQVVMPPEGEAGSIGALRLHMDMSRALEQEGVKVTILAAGKHKADGNMFQPLPPDLAARAMAELEAIRTRFADAVGAHRGKRFTAEQAMATEADTYRGEEAERIGLVDAVGKPADAFDAFVASVNRARRPTKGERP